MSDFDREAERERLREKYENDRRERQSTQRMSELLLKGATMTNRHCEECGDPIFRHDGTEFCPTCRHEGATDGTAADAGATDGTAADAGAATDADGPDDATAGESDADPRPASVDAPGARRPAAADQGADGRTADDPDVAGRQRGGRPERTATAPAAGGDDGEGRAAARASLERSLVRFARAAEGTDDPRRARDLLAAAREAAEALAALDRR